MGRAIDLTGKRFGRLTVIREAGRVRRLATWLCKCDCGNECIAVGANLRRGATKSCGCLRDEGTTAPEDLTGKRFGRLTAVKRCERAGKHDRPKWLCKCDCGNECVVLARYLKQGKVQSCGCIQGKNSPTDLFDGTMIGSLTRKKGRNNTTGVKGVSFNKRRGTYVAEIMIRRKKIYLGEFHSLEEAKKARQRAEEKYFVPEIEKWESEREGDSK